MDRKNKKKWEKRSERAGRALWSGRTGLSGQVRDKEGGVGETGFKGRKSKKLKKRASRVGRLLWNERTRLSGQVREEEEEGVGGESSEAGDRCSMEAAAGSARRPREAPGAAVVFCNYMESVTRRPHLRLKYWSVIFEVIFSGVGEV